MQLLEAGRATTAISAFAEAVRLDPGNAAAHHGLGSALFERGRFDEAVECLRLAAALQDDAAVYQCLAAALRAQRCNGEAAAAYRRAIELDPSLTSSHLGLADLCQGMGDDETAARALRCAAALAPDTAAGRLYLARALMFEGDFAAAQALLVEAAALDPTDDQVLKLLGDALARLGRFGAAEAMYERALALNPSCAAAHFAAAEIRTHTAADRPRLARIEAALADPALDDGAKISLLFAAGKILDDWGQYKAAMQHFDAANRLRGRHASFDAAAFAGEIDRLVSRYTPEFFAANADFGRSDETPLLIVGLPRSGTTLVEQILSRHRQIGGGGEQGFWVRRALGTALVEARYLTVEAGRELSGEYLSLLRRLVPSAARVTDKLPFNVLCAGLIHLLLPKARIIQCRRHPADTCLSIYFTHFQQTISFASDKAALAAAYRQYCRVMDHWRAVLPRHALYEVEYERLVSDREAVTRELIAFAGLGWDDSCLRPEENRRPVATASLWQARQPVYSSSIARWRNYRPWLGELCQLLSKAELESGAN